MPPCTARIARGRGCRFRRSHTQAWRGLYASRMETSSPEETEALAAELAVRLVTGDVVTVSGELGSGKTTFVRGACRALGVRERVTSPTYTIGHRYHSDRGDAAQLALYR